MSSTNRTANYNLPQFIGTDKPTWLGDVNPAMSTIDTQMKANADGVTTANGAVTELTTRVEDAETTVTNLNTRVGTIESQTSNISGEVSTLNTSVAQIIAQLNLSQHTQNTISLAGNRQFVVHLSQNSDGSLFKFYGQCYIDNNTSTSITLGTKQLIAGTSDKYGIATGLTLNQTPSTAYVITQAGYGLFNTRGYNKGNTNYMDAGNAFAVQIYVGTDGQIYISLAGNDWSQSNVTFSEHTRSRQFWLPQLYWNGDFGDTPGE